MATFRGSLKNAFPLKNIDDVVRLFRQHLESTSDPDLTLLSILTGMIENTLTSKCAISSSDSTPATTTTGDVGTGQPHQQQHQDAFSSFPVIELDAVTELYDKFNVILSLVEPDISDTNITSTTVEPKYASRELIKKVSDIIWNSLIRSTYKDRAHLQSLYSYLAGSKLDCFGVALAVVAGCQRLGYTDVHLAISEDHAWVVFGPTGSDTIEVTWHGKGTEDKRGQPTTAGYQSRSWLYLSGNPVVCTRPMEVAAIVSAINPSLNMTSTCLEVADLQQQLLWLLYDLNHLQKYPMGLGCLGELEEVAPTLDRPSCEKLYAQSVRASRLYYRNHHVYPYTYQGVYYYRQNQYKDAFSSWANAGDVIRLYNYSRDDEEIYKEFLDIANEHIPLIMKTESSGHSAHSVLRDPQCFANLLRFYDGICQWEEGSQTPILHIGWAKPLVTTISRFDGDIRSQVIINLARDSDDVHKCAAAVTAEAIATSEAESNNNEAVSGSIDLKQQQQSSNNKSSNTTTNNGEPVISSLEALTAACGEKILNPEFLLQGGGQPFAENPVKPNGDSNVNDSKDGTVDTTTTTTSEKIELFEDISKKEPLRPLQPLVPTYTPPDDIVEPVRPTITLYSRKMKGIRDLLIAEKLNTQAISLQVTAQSQVQVGGKKGRSMANSVSYATKRSRRQT